jgi:hypothetical protein
MTYTRPEHNNPAYVRIESLNSDGERATEYDLATDFEVPPSWVPTGAGTYIWTAPESDISWEIQVINQEGDRQ